MSTFWGRLRWIGTAIVVVVAVAAFVMSQNNTGSRGSSGGSHQQTNPAADRYRMN